MNPAVRADDYLSKSAEEDLLMSNDTRSKPGFTRRESKLGVAAAASVGALTFLSGLPATRAADAPVAGQQQSPSIQAPGTVPQQQAPGQRPPQQQAPGPVLRPPQQQAPTPIQRPPQQQAPGQPERPALPKPALPKPESKPPQS